MKEDSGGTLIQVRGRRGERCDHKMLLDKLQLIVAEIIIILVVILVLSSGTNHPVRVDELDQTWIVFMLEIKLEIFQHPLPHRPESSLRYSQ